MNQTKWSIGNLNKGKRLTPLVKRKISGSIRKGFNSGRTVWNKGMAWSDEIKSKISNSKKGSTPWNVGIARTEEERKKISQGRIGKPAWNKGKIWTSKEKKKMSEGAKRMWERRRKLIEA